MSTPPMRAPIESNGSWPAPGAAGSRGLALYVCEGPVDECAEGAAALREAGYEVDIVPTKKFRYRSAAGNESVTVVLFDISAPEGRSYTLCNRLRCLSSRPILVILRGQASTEVMRAYRAGADMCVPVPLHKNEFLARVAALVRRSTGSWS